MSSILKGTHGAVTSRGACMFAHSLLHLRQGHNSTPGLRMTGRLRLPCSFWNQSLGEAAGLRSVAGSRVLFVSWRADQVASISLAKSAPKRKTKTVKHQNEYMKTAQYRSPECNLAGATESLRQDKRHTPHHLEFYSMSCDRVPSYIDTPILRCTQVQRIPSSPHHSNQVLPTRLKFRAKRDEPAFRPSERDQRQKLRSNTFSSHGDGECKCPRRSSSLGSPC
jgi:hypothetical protein